MSDIPPELVEEILSRVPTTSLSRLQYTCKQWNALLKDKGFTEKHFRKAPKQSLVLMLKGFRNFSHHRLVVWNPCLGETRWIQPKTDYKRFSSFALGYENNKFCHSFKILRCYYQYKKLVGCEIYDFRCDSWRVLVDGNAYWLAYHKIGSSKFLLTFDFTRERFRCLRLPTILSLGWTVLLVASEEKLSLLHWNNGSSKMDMWVTNKIDTEAPSWSKSFTVDGYITNHEYNCYYHPTRFLMDEEKKVAVCCIESYEPISGMVVYKL
ncbi:putative F-box protein At3g22710 [Eutrema salsugineum]|uniref:putative F-box protein At3g22710 n=1 Tax=Eutrema salsugineum TaxID=72664 RepID=UPI000CED5923|nr:putative F-box protein At3g22710 [Eutrema salsugineum]